MASYEFDNISDLFDSAEFDVLYYLGDHVDRANVSVCVLVPYQSSLRDDSGLDMRAINESLASSGLDFDEGLWHLIFWDGQELDHSSIRTGADYMLKQGGLGAEFSSLLGRFGLVASSCAPIEALSFIKYRVRGQSYITFGVVEK